MLASPRFGDFTRTPPSGNGDFAVLTHQPLRIRDQFEAKLVGLSCTDGFLTSHVRVNRRSWSQVARVRGNKGHLGIFLKTQGDYFKLVE